MSGEMVGAKVTLRKESCWARGGLDPSNPIGVVGVIIYQRGNSYGVRWSNGRENNCYRIPDDLKVIGVFIES